MTWTMWAALIVVVGTVWGLVKKYETRLVLLVSGLIMTILSLDPMAAFQQFDKSMTNNSLIIVICSSMGFAAVMNLTKCDLHLVSLLTKPLNKLGLLLLPCCMIVTGITSLAISSLSGMCAAIGPTLVGLMIRAGFRPAMAAAVGQSRAKRVLIPFSHCDNIVAGVPELATGALIQCAVRSVTALAGELADGPLESSEGRA